MIERKQIEDVVRESLNDTGAFLVDVRVSHNNMVQVFIDHNNGISLDDCAGLHRRLEAQFDREKEDFELQVSSPGLGQPIRVFPQYQKAIGQKLEIVSQDGDIIKGILMEAHPAETEKEAELVVRQTATRRKQVPDDLMVIQINRIKTARVELDFKQV